MLNVKLTGLAPGTSAIEAVKSLRAITGGSLTWAKRDVYDQVRLGRTVLVDLRDDHEIEALREGGWQMQIEAAEGLVPVSLLVPAEHRKLLVDFATAVLGGKVTS